MLSGGVIYTGKFAIFDKIDVIAETIEIVPQSLRNTNRNS